VRLNYAYHPPDALQSALPNAGQLIEERS